MLLQVTSDIVTSALDIEKIGIVGILFLLCVGLYRFFIKQIKDLNSTHEKQIADLKQENKELKADNAKIRDEIIQIQRDLGVTQMRMMEIIEHNTKALERNNDIISQVYGKVVSLKS
jgi:hypothetical protein